MAVHVARRPEWLAALLSEKFFVPCETHSAEKKNERNVFCADCNVGICQHCASRCHVNHMLLQIRRYVYHDVIRLIDIQKLIDCALVQPYIINSAKVVFLNPRPLSRPAKASGNANSCASCERGLQDGYSFCCVACKVDTALKRGGLSKILQQKTGPGSAGFRNSPPEFRQREPKIEHPCEALARSRGFVGGLPASARRRRPRPADLSVGASTVDRRRCNSVDVEEKQRISPHSVFLHHDTVSAASSSSISASSISAAHRSRRPIPELDAIHIDEKSRDSVMVSNPNRDSSMVARHPRSPARPPPAALCRKSPISPARQRNSPTSPSMPAQSSPPSDDRSCRFLAQPPPPLPDSPVLRLPKLASSLPCLRIRLPSLSLTTKSPSPSPPTVRSCSSPPSFLAPHYLQKSYDATGATGFFFEYDNDCESDDGDDNSVGTDEDEFAIPDSPAEQLNFISFRSISCADRLDFMSYRKRKRKNSPVRARFS